MALIETLASLFAEGAVPIAEQFIRGTVDLPSLFAALDRKFGESMRATRETVNEFQNAVYKASIPSQIIQGGAIPPESVIPIWPESKQPGRYIQTGLAEITAALPTGEKLYSTHSLIQFYDDEIQKYESIRDRVLRAIAGGQGSDADWYEKDIDRIDRVIDYQRELRANVTANVTLYSTFRGE